MLLQTERLTLRPFAPQDEDAFITGIEDDELRHMYGFPMEMSHEKAQRIFERFSSLSSAMSLARKADGVMVGFLLDVPLELPEQMHRSLPEGGRTLAFAIFPPHQRQGYMREALAAWIEQHRESKDVAFLHAGHFPFNVPSQRLLAALRFTAYGQHTVGTVSIMDRVCML